MKYFIITLLALSLSACANNSPLDHYKKAMQRIAPKAHENVQTISIPQMLQNTRHKQGVQPPVRYSIPSHIVKHRAATYLPRIASTRHNITLQFAKNKTHLNKTQISTLRTLKLRKQKKITIDMGGVRGQNDFLSAHYAMVRANYIRKLLPHISVTFRYKPNIPADSIKIYLTGARI